jgi:hypothetical protein
MAIMINGIFGSFTGAVGNVVGVSSRGKKYIRSRSVRRTSPSSQKQLEQQLKFSLVTRFQQPLRGLLNQTFPSYKTNTTGVNRALSYNLRNAVSGVYPAYTINYSMFLISRGCLAKPQTPTATAGGDGLVNFAWTNDARQGRGEANDKAVLVIYCPDIKECVYITEGAERGTGAASIDVSGFVGKTVQTWIGFISDSGKDVATSIYTGEVTVA